MRITTCTPLLLLPLITLAQAGTVDTNFGISGLAAPDGYPNESEFGWTVDVLPGGELFVIGQRTNTQQLGVRFNADGSLDNTYGVNGFAPGQNMVVRDGRRLPDGRFLAVGEGANLVYVTRRLPDGSADLTYGTNGLATADVSATQEFVEGCWLGTDGSLFITGYNGATPFDIFVLKLDSTGTPDLTFGTNGIVQSTYPELDRAYDVIEDDQGRVVVAGLSRDVDSYLTLWRFLADGTPDATFGTNGEFRALSGTGAGFGEVRQDAAGNYVAAGYLASGGVNEVKVYRATTNGTLDMTFGTNGVQGIDNGTGETTSDLLVLPDGRIYVSGHSNTLGTGNNFYAIRLLPDGTPDPAFGTNGVGIAGAIGNAICRALAVDAQGGVILAGHKPFSTFDRILLMRLFGDGTVDVGFGAEPEALQVYPNPTPDGRVSVRLPDGNLPDQVLVLDAAGRAVPVRVERSAGALIVHLPTIAGTYTISAQQDGRRWVASVVR